MDNFDVIIIGGGASGFFTAINIASNSPNLRIAILEKGKQVLTKVKISGGGRCNVTHAQFLPDELVLAYPRGQKELLGPFHNFMTGDTMAWFESHGVHLKIEPDGRVFPESNSSSTIIDCFLQLSKTFAIEVITASAVKKITFDNIASTYILTTAACEFRCNKVVFATGSSTQVWKLLYKIGHAIVPPVPSLFTFNIKDTRISDLMGLSSKAGVTIPAAKLASDGDLLITHWGLSGPAILKLSAWGARVLETKNYNFDVHVNWTHSLSKNEVLTQLLAQKSIQPKKVLFTHALFGLPKRLWHSLLNYCEFSTTLRWADVSKKHLETLAEVLVNSVFKVTGKSTFKEEFVTAGGVDLKEVNFKTFQSKIIPNAYIVGECLNIDAITGGYNFQNAWTSGFLAAKHICESYE